MKKKLFMYALSIFFLSYTYVTYSSDMTDNEINYWNRAAEVVKNFFWNELSAETKDKFSSLENFYQQHAKCIKGVAYTIFDPGSESGKKYCYCDYDESIEQYLKKSKVCSDVQIDSLIRLEAIRHLEGCTMDDIIVLGQEKMKQCSDEQKLIIQEKLTSLGADNGQAKYKYYKKRGLYCVGAPLISTFGSSVSSKHWNCMKCPSAEPNITFYLSEEQQAELKRLKKEYRKKFAVQNGNDKKEQYGDNLENDNDPGVDDSNKNDKNKFNTSGLSTREQWGIGLLVIGVPIFTYMYAKYTKKKNPLWWAAAGFGIAGILSCFYIYS